MSKPKIRFKGYEEDWEQRKLGDVTELKSASRVHKGEWTDSGVPFFRSSDVMAAINGTTNEKAYISEELYEKLSNASGKLEEGDVLVTGGGSVGNPYIVPNNEPLYTKDADLLWIKNQGRFYPYFLYEYFFSPTFRIYLSNISHVGTIAHYTITQLSETPISLPDIEEQIKVGEYFESLDRLITLHQRKCEETKKLKNLCCKTCLYRKEYKNMKKIVLYHGTPDKVFTPTYGKGNEKHDYGKGFYLTESIDLAKEWAVCRPNEENGWVHKYELDCKDLKVLDFQKLSVLTWLAELMKHRDAADSKRYRMLAAKFIEKYGVETEGYDVIKGWRANASYFYIAKEFVRDNIDIDILEELLSLGGLGIQYCIKSEKAYNNLHELKEELVPVDYSEFNERYNDRDVTARKNMRDLINSDANEVTKVFSTLL